MAEKTITRITTPKFRVSFPHVFQPSNNLNGKPKYSIVMIFEKGTDLSPLKELMKAAATKKWGDKIPKLTRETFRDGNEKSYDGYSDTIFATASSKQKPGVVDEQVQPIISEEEFYAGCYARATITAYAYDTAGNIGVAFGLQNIQKLADGESLIGKARPEDEFEAIAEGAAGAENPELFGKDDLNTL